MTWDEATHKITTNTHNVQQLAEAYKALEEKMRILSLNVDSFGQQLQVIGEKLDGLEQ